MVTTIEKYLEQEVANSIEQKKPKFLDQKLFYFHAAINSIEKKFVLFFVVVCCSRILWRSDADGWILLLTGWHEDLVAWLRSFCCCFSFVELVLGNIRHTQMFCQVLFYKVHFFIFVCFFLFTLNLYLYFELDCCCYRKPKKKSHFSISQKNHLLFVVFLYIESYLWATKQQFT